LYLRARARVQLKEWDEAQPDVEEALSIRKKVFGGKGEEMPKTLSLQGQVYLGQKKLDEALKAHEEAKELRVELFGRDHLEVAASLSNISKVLQAQGKLEEAKLEEAKVLLEEALKIQRGHLGKEHEYVAYTEEGMGNLLKQMGKLTEATVQFHSALETAKKLKMKDFEERVKKAIESVEALKEEQHQTRADMVSKARKLPDKQWREKVDKLREVVAMAKRSVSFHSRSLTLILV